MTKKILVVDDNDNNLYLLQSLLEGYGYEVLTAKNGQEALDKAHADPPHLVVSDILMPQVDGYTLCRLWKSDERLKHIPFMFYTATYTSAKDEDFALSLGADRFVIKPQEPAELTAIITGMLDKKYKARQVGEKSLGEETRFFKNYNEVLFRKLEKKMKDLERVNQQLTQEKERYREQSEFLQQFIDIVPSPMFYKDREGKYRVSNKAFQSYLGLDKEAIIGKTVFEVAPPDLAAKYQEMDLDLLNHPGRQSYEYPVRYGDGSLHDVDFEKATLVDAGGEVKGLAGVMFDITERKQMERALRSSEEMYRLSFWHASDVIYSINTGLQVTAVSPSVERILGYKPDDLAGRSVHDLSQIFTPESLEKAIADMNIVLSGSIIKSQIYEFIAKDGSRVFGEVSGAPIINDGKIIGLISIARDITEHKLAVDKLRESETKYRVLFDFLPVPVFEMDLKANITAANRAIYKAFGYTEDDFQRGFNAWQIMAPEEIEKSRKNIQSMLIGEKMEGTEYLLKRKDGSVFPAIVISDLITQAQGPIGIRGAMIDITERKAAFERLQKTLAATVQAMTVVVETRDPYTAGHQRRVSHLACAIAANLNLSADKVDCIRIASSLHDIGKISIPGEILSKPTRLTKWEFEWIKAHPLSGHAILKEIEFPWPIAQIVLEHHERMNGSGYPKGLVGEDIMFESRILAVADVVEAMASHRPYRPTLGIDAALDEIRSQSGILFDKQVVEACLRLFKEGYSLPS